MGLLCLTILFCIISVIRKSISIKLGIKNKSLSDLDNIPNPAVLTDDIIYNL